MSYLSAHPGPYTDPDVLKRQAAANRRMDQRGHVMTAADVRDLHGDPEDGAGGQNAVWVARNARQAQLDAMAAVVQRVERSGQPNLDPSDSAAIEAHRSEVNKLDLLAEGYGRRGALEAQTHVDHGNVGRSEGGMGHWFVGGGPATYSRSADSPSFFKDLRDAKRGDADAADRLRRNNAERAETRALGNTGGVGGSGGEFAPPAWLLEEFVAMARAGRVTADLFHHEELPAGVSSVNLPRVVTGTTTAVQTTQNTALSQTDLTTASLSASVVTIGGKQVVSRQLLDQGGIPVDQVILQDLAADYARQIGAQVLIGTGASGQLRGYLTPASTNSVTWTQAAPTAALFFSQMAKLQSQLNTSRLLAPNAIVLHPRRWAWLASATDTTGRPLVLPTGGGFNAMASSSDAAAAGAVGTMLGVPVYTDPAIPTTLGGGTQDVALMFNREDVWLWESPLRVESFEDTLADSASVLYRILGYSAMIPDRYLAGLGQLGGTGMVAPVFAG